MTAGDSAMQPVGTVPGTIKSRRLLRAGIGIFGGLGIVTAVWWLIAGNLPLSYVLVMIPASALGVICIFQGFVGGHFNHIRSDIAELAVLAQTVARHEDRLTSAETRIHTLEKQFGELRDDIKKATAHGYLEAVRARQSTNGAGPHLRVVDQT